MNEKQEQAQRIPLSSVRCCLNCGALEFDATQNEWHSCDNHRSAGYSRYGTPNRLVPATKADIQRNIQYYDHSAIIKKLRRVKP